MYNVYMYTYMYMFWLFMCACHRILVTTKLCVSFSDKKVGGLLCMIIRAATVRTHLPTCTPLCVCTSVIQSCSPDTSVVLGLERRCAM